MIGEALALVDILALCVFLDMFLVVVPRLCVLCSC
jgi:hypothetical protein